MKKYLKNILFISYLGNKGVRRICFIFGCLLALLPIYSFGESIYVKHEYDDLRNAVVFKPEIQKRYVFENYKYECDGCKGSTDFGTWKKSFTDADQTRLFLETDCSHVGDHKSTCERVKNYLSQRVSVSYVNFTAFDHLKWGLILFYFPFFLACAVKWVVSGFKQSKKRKKSKK